MADFNCTVTGCGFKSTNHATKRQADARGAEHKAEHETGKPMREIGEFMKEQS